MQPGHIETDDSFVRFIVEDDYFSTVLDEAALDRAGPDGRRHYSALWEYQVMPASDLADAVAIFHQVPRLDTGRLRYDPEVLGDLSVRYLKENWILPFHEAEGIMLAIADPTREAAIEAVELAIGRSLAHRIAAFDEMQAVFELVFSPTVSAYVPPGREAAAIPDERSLDDDLERLQDLASGAPVVQAVDEMLGTAVRLSATDIHVEPQRGGLRIRLRVDGRLRLHRSLPAPLARAIISRIKILAGLDIAERRLPQDGRTRVMVDGSEADLRIATMPTMHGESAVIRLLAREASALDLSRLGMRERDLSIFREQLAEPHGLVIVAGPTGSGKTTTLTAAMSLLNDPERKIMTVEDPIEYQIAGINQTQVKPSINLTFATALRSFLRHDPDVLMVGEMRDRETAAIGIQAALTGHLVLTTLHTNNAAEAVVRLIDLGIDGFLLRSALRCVVGQRLVRRLCPHCREPQDAPSAAARSLIERRLFEPRQTDQYFKAGGCDFCAGTGFRGRIGIFEVLKLDPDIRSRIRSDLDPAELNERAQMTGMSTMLQDGLDKYRTGITTVEEVLRATM